MMKLSEIYDALATGELKNLRLSEDNQITAQGRKVLLSSINAGLTDLYTRFLLKKNDIEMSYNKSREQYRIGRADLIEILSVKLNDVELKVNHADGYHLLDPATIHIDKGIERSYLHSADELNVLTVVYKANHKKLTEEDILLDSDVELPDSYLNALLYFVASRLFASIPNQLDGDVNEGLRYSKRYFDEINMLINQGVDVDGINEFALFNVRGFV